MAADDARAAAEEPTSIAARTEEVIESVADQEFRLAVEILYHGSRQAFFAGAHRWAMFATILFGAGAAAAIYPALSGIMAAAAGAADIAFDLTDRAQLHADIRRRYYEMVAELAETGAVANFGRRWMALSADEPPVYRWAEIIAHRNACIALRREVPKQMSLLRRLSAHFLRG